MWCHLRLLCNGTTCCATSAEGEAEAEGHSAEAEGHSEAEGGWTSTRPSATIIEAIFDTIAFTTGPGGSIGI